VDRTLKDYAVNGAEKYWMAPYDSGYRKGERSTRFWTLTIHQPECRFAKANKNGNPYQAYLGLNGLEALASNGFDPPARMGVDSVWQGCKVCGTVHLDARALGREAIEARKRYEKAQSEQYRQEQARNTALARRNAAEREAVSAWLHQHSAEIAAIEAQAAADWAEANPEQAALILTNDEA
jgi:hypothetical protein